MQLPQPLPVQLPLALQQAPDRLRVLHLPPPRNTHHRHHRLRRLELHVAVADTWLHGTGLRPRHSMSESCRRCQQRCHRLPRRRCSMCHRCCRCPRSKRCCSCRRRRCCSCRCCGWSASCFLHCSASLGISTEGCSATCCFLPPSIRWCRRRSHCSCRRSDAQDEAQRWLAPWPHCEDPPRRSPLFSPLVGRLVHEARRRAGAAGESSSLLGGSGSSLTFIFFTFFFRRFSSQLFLRLCFSRHRSVWPWQLQQLEQALLQQCSTITRCRC